MGYGTRVTFDSVRELGFGSMGATFVAVGSPLTDHVRLLGLNSSLNEEVYVSFDGITDHLRMASNSFKLYDLSANKIRDDGLFLAVGTQIYVREVSASVASGSFWVEAMFGEGGR